MERKLSSRDVILDILSMKSFAKQLLGKNKPYELLLQVLLYHEFETGENYHLPSMGELQQITGIKYTKLRKQLMKIYEDLYEQEENGLIFSIPETEYVFCMHYFKEYAYLSLYNLTHIPKVGEQIEIPFFRSRLGTETFYVQSIIHQFSDTKQTITFDLHPGFFNPFWYIRKGEAYLKSEITLDEYYDHMDEKIKEKLKYHEYLF